MSVFEISELELSAALLPAREALGGLNLNVADITAENTAVAINGGFGDAVATAEQDLDVGQHSGW